MDVQDYISAHLNPDEVEEVEPSEDGVEGFRRWPHRRGYRYPRYGRRSYRPFWWNYPYSAQYMGYGPNLPTYYHPVKVQAPTPAPTPAPEPAN